MIIGIGADHRGLEKKQQLINYLTKKGYNVKDYGANSKESTDYPLYAFKVGEAIRDKHLDLGILICGTGIGMSIAANKINDVRCAKVDTKEEAKLSRLHNNANIIALSNNHSITKMKGLITTFLDAKFSNEERHIRRVELINNYNEH